MTVTLTAGLTAIDNCDSATNWTSNETIVADTAIYREGAGAIAIQKVSQETSYAQYDYYTDNGNTYLNLTGESHIYFWTMCRQSLDTKAAGGIRLRLTDSSGNYREWYVGGSGDYYGGFQNYVIYTGTTPNNSSGTLVLNAIRYVTFYWKVTSKTIVAANDCYVDMIYYGTGLIVKGGTSGAKGTFDEIIAADLTPAYGILSKKFGVFVLQGPVTFGDNSGTTDTYFKDESQVIMFADAMVSSTHYEIKVVGNATGTNSFELGSKSGTAGISGCFIKSTSVSLPFKLTATDTNNNVFKLYGCTFDTHGVVDTCAAATNKEIVNCTFSNGQGEIQPNTMVFTRNTITGHDSTVGAVLYESTSHGITYTTFVNNVRAAEFTVGGTYTLTGDQFTGNTYDLHFTASSGNLVIACGGNPKANPSTNENHSSGTVTINNTITMTVTVRNSANTLISGARVKLVAAEDNTEFPYQDAITIARTSSTATVTLNAHGLQTNEYVEITGATQPEYNGVFQITYLTANTFSYTVSGTPATPATGSPICTFVLLSGTTTAGVLTSSTVRYIANDLDFTGVVRKTSASTYYKQGIVSGTMVNSDYSTTVFLSTDE